jgi:phosphoribosyl 1,2-cyclic phosphodiesterase
MLTVFFILSSLNQIHPVRRYNFIVLSNILFFKCSHLDSRQRLGYYESMFLRFCSISSGSSGNCYLVRTESTALLVDAGISASRIVNGLISARTDPDEVRGILLTHEHTDHIGGIGPTANRLSSASIFATAGTWEGAKNGRTPKLSIAADREERVRAGDDLRIGDIGVTVVRVSHDAAEPVGYVFESDAGRIAIITDTGIFSEEMASKAADADVFVIEANHDVEMLKNGRYPPFLKQRILGSEGHLSNASAAAAVLDVIALESKPRCVLLAHLSRDNNTPKKAEFSISEALADYGHYVGKDLYLKSLPRESMSMVFEI